MNVFAMILAALWMELFQALPASREFSSADCHIAFAHPGGWDVERIESVNRSEPCWFEVGLANRKQLVASPEDVDVYTITVVVSDEGLEDALPRSLFERENGAWFVLGRLGTRYPAQPIGNAGWTGARGTKIIECFRKGGKSAGLCEVPAAFIGTTRRSAELEGGPASEQAFDIVLRSLRFLP